MSTFLYGWALTQKGDMVEGLTYMQESIALFQETGAELGAAYFAGLFAATLADAGQVDFGLAMMDEAFNLMTRNKDYWCEAELHRLKGEILAKHSSLDDVETNNTLMETCFQTAITVAQSQLARWWELQATMSLGQLWYKQGRTEAARQIIEDMISRFPEGADVPHIKEARAMILE